MTVFSVVFVLGIASTFFAFFLAFNTSMGGTRSDYNNGSSIMFDLGCSMALIGAVGFIVKWILS
jgi:hypothetical protein